MKYILIALLDQGQKEKLLGKFIGKVKFRFKNLDLSNPDLKRVYNLPLKPPEGMEFSKSHSQIVIVLEIEVEEMNMKSGSNANIPNRLKIGERKGSCPEIVHRPKNAPPSFEQRAAEFTPLPPFDFAFEF